MHSMRAALSFSLLLAVANMSKPFDRNIMTTLEMLKEQRRRNEDRRESSCSYLQCDVRARKKMASYQIPICIGTRETSVFFSLNKI